MDFYEEDMKRCPFCGELASLVQSDDKCRIECTNCKATTILYNNKKEAIFSWNRRV